MGPVQKMPLHMCQRGRCAPSRNCSCLPFPDEKRKEVVFRYVWGKYKRTPKPCWKHYLKTALATKLEPLIDKMSLIFDVTCTCTTKHMCDVCDGLTDEKVGSLLVGDEDTVIYLSDLDKIKSYFMKF